MARPCFLELRDRLFATPTACSKGNYVGFVSRENVSQPRGLSLLQHKTVGKGCCPVSQRIRRSESSFLRPSRGRSRDSPRRGLHQGNRAKARSRAHCTLDLWRELCFDAHAAQSCPGGRFNERRILVAARRFQVSTFCLLCECFRSSFFWQS